MIVKGKIEIDLFKYCDCKINIKYGKINEIIIPDVTPLLLNSLQIEASTDYEFEKHYDSKKAPYKSNYYIRYKGGFKSQHMIFLKLNLFKMIRLKYSMRKWIIQSNDMKKDILKYIIGGVLGYFGALIIPEVKEYKKVPDNPPKTESQKSLEHKNLKTETKKDTNIIK